MTRLAHQRERAGHREGQWPLQRSLRGDHDNRPKQRARGSPVWTVLHVLHGRKGHARRTLHRRDAAEGQRDAEATQYKLILRPSQAGGRRRGPRGHPGVARLAERSTPHTTQHRTQAGTRSTAAAQVLGMCRCRLPTLRLSRQSYLPPTTK